MSRELPPHEAHPVLSAAGTGGLIGSVIVGGVFWHWLPVLVGVVIFVGTATAAAWLNVRDL